MVVALALLGLIFFESEILGLAGLAGLRLNSTLKRVDHAAVPAASFGGGGATAAAATAASPLTDAASLYAYASRADALAALAATPASLLAPLTLEAQRLLYEWQHPAVCVGKRFLVSRGNEETAGLGSHVHITTHHVALALELGMIFLWHADAGLMYTDEVTCTGAMNFECFFDAPSNCTLEDARDPASSITEVVNGDVGLRLPGEYQFYHVPRVFADLWTRANLPVVFGETTRQADAQKLWFRAQAAAYLTRFNARSVEALRALRLNATLMQHVAGPHAAAGASAPAFPLGAGTVALHIRHGDKGTEMALVPTEAYLSAATALARAQPLALGAHRMFLSTEDPDAVAAVAAAVRGAVHDARTGAWTLAYWDVPRENSNGKSQLAKFGLPRAQLTLVWWLQLLLALEADAWVGTRGSNWNRLIDELRCVWVAKCANIFVEVGDAARWEHLSWR
jgi:hypothetical protein